MTYLSVPRLPQGKIRAIAGDPVKSASAANLVYVHDSEPGIRRIRRRGKFIYIQGNKKVSARDDQRIRKLVIPPAWENVWVCPLDNGHLQATGFDLRNRKQYKYHVLWSEVRSHTKFYRLYEFGKALPLIRRRLEKDLALPGLPLNKVLAAVVSLMEHTGIRIGNCMYEKLYGSYGLTTLKDRHVKFEGDKMLFCFRGKKGVQQKISFKSRRLARIVRQCRDIPGKELFQYYDNEGRHRSIDSGMVNDYLKEITGRDFTAKDFRTWAGTLCALAAFKDLEPARTATAVKRNIVFVLDTVAVHLGNTRSVCKKYYVHPQVIALYEEGKLDQIVKEKMRIKNESSSGLTPEEKKMMKILNS